MTKLKMGIIGAGKIAQVLHAPNIHKSKFAELIAITDVDESRLLKFKEDYPYINTYTDYKKMLAEEELDAVSVCVSNNFHAAVSIDALNSGKNVLVEKPMATSSAEASDMIKVSKDQNKVLMVDHLQRFFPHHQKAKEIVSAGILGEIRAVKAMFGHAGPENWSPTASWFFQRQKSAFGSLADLGIHKIDIIRYVTGLEFQKCVALTNTLEKHADVEDIAMGIFQLSNGALAEITASWVTHGLEENYLIIYGSSGTMKVGSVYSNQIDIYLEKPVKFHGKIELKPLFTNEDEYWNLPIIDHFAKVCLGEEKPIVTAEDGLVALNIIEKMLIAEREDKIVELSK